MPKTPGIGSPRPPVRPSSPSPSPASGPAATPAPRNEAPAPDRFLGEARRSAPVSLDPAGAATQGTHGSVLDRVKAFLGIFRKVPEAIGRSLHETFESTADSIRFARSRTDAQLAAMTPAQLADLADDLLETGDLVEAFEHADRAACTTELARVLSARGTAPGGPESIVALMERAGDAAARTGGPDRERALALLSPRPATPGDWQGFERYLDAATGSVRRPGTSVRPLIDGAEAFPAMFRAIDSARETVSLTFYAFHSDATGWDCARRLAAAADRGCAVRVMVDPIGSMSTGRGATDPALFDFLRLHGVQVDGFATGAMADGMNHRKILVVDGKVGFTGGMNLGDEYREVWHDVHAEVAGPGVADLQASFLEQWRREGNVVSSEQERALFPTLASAGGGTARVVAHQGNEDLSLKLAYLRAIDTAQTSIDIANPYVSDSDVIERLVAAGKRGVQVTLIFPTINDSSLERDVARSWYDQLSAAGARIYEYPDRMAHQKVAIFDGKLATIGSSNLDDRSLETNDECNVWTTDGGTVRDLEERLFAPDLAASTRVTSYKPGLFRSMWTDVLRRFEDLL